jgi:hypothetical protein
VKETTLADNGINPYCCQDRYWHASNIQATSVLHKHIHMHSIILSLSL